MLSKVQQDFEEAVLKHDKKYIMLDKFADGEHWGSEDLTNCYMEGITEICFSFFKLGRKNKSTTFFETELFKSSGKKENLSKNEQGYYIDDFVSLLWKYFSLA